MRRSALSIAFLGSSCLLLVANRAAAASRADLCSVPNMKTDKWHSTTEVGGMTVMLPPGFVARGIATGTGNADSHGYFSGTHRFILIGSGSGPSNLSVGGAALLQTADCETVLGGRRAELTSYTWTEEDDAMSPSGQAGPQYMAVARFFATGTQREVYVAFKSNIQSDIGSNRQIFWTVSFPGYASWRYGTCAADGECVARCCSAGCGCRRTGSPRVRAQSGSDAPSGERRSRQRARADAHLRLLDQCQRDLRSWRSSSMVRPLPGSTSRRVICRIRRRSSWRRSSRRI